MSSAIHPSQRGLEEEASRSSAMSDLREAVSGEEESDGREGDVSSK